MTSDACAEEGGFVDLHTHSTASDGAVEPAEVVRSAAAIGLKAIALTDHDTIDGYNEAAAEGECLGVRVIQGCELSAYEKSNEIHLLVLHISKPELLAPHLERFRDERHNRAVQMVEKLNAIGIPLQFEDVLKESDGGVIGRPHVARALLTGGFIKEFREAFDKLIGFHGPAHVSKPRLEVEEAIRIGHEAGGLVYWAHPGRDGGRDKTRRLVDAGLDGLELVHPSHTFEDIKRLDGFIKEFSLSKTGGSDWHGAREGYRTLGNMNIPFSWLEEQEELVKSRGSL